MVIHNQAIKELAPAEYRVIEKEHKLLEKYLSDLRDACGCSNLDQAPDCQACDHEKQASCQGQSIFITLIQSKFEYIGKNYR